MITLMKQMLTDWDSERNQRLKLQKAYFFVALLLAVSAGLITLLNPSIGAGLIMVAAFIAAIYLTNAVSWTVADLIVSKKISSLVKAPATKTSPAKKR